MEERHWRKSAQSEGESNCVEVAHTLDAVRDSKNPDVILAVTSAALASMLRLLGR